MNPLLDRYVRSLKERDAHPEQRNDLGTLLTWILEREGFTVLERAFKHTEHERRVSQGRKQFGIDLLAVREKQGEQVGYRFVLKQGDIKTFVPGDPGSMASDLWNAAQAKDREERYGYAPARVTVVAVHNGDRDSEAIGQLIEAQLANIREKADVGTEWWDAARLVGKIDAILLGEHGGDSSFFPPALQPFVRLTIDSLLPERGPAGTGFDYPALDLLIARRLALGPTVTPGARVENAEELHRRVAELALVAWMVRHECERVASSTTLPTLDTVERIVCGAMAAATQLPGVPTKALRDDFTALLALHRESAEQLLAKIDPLLALDAGLVAPTHGEAVNYPLRVLRFSGYVAVAGLAAHADGDATAALRLAARLKDLWSHNETACFVPVTDDQLIEVVLVWELWKTLGMHDDVSRTAVRIVEHLAAARAVGAPLPALWQRARIPMSPEQLTLLVETRVLPPSAWDGTFSDGASYLLSAAIYLARRSGRLTMSDHAPFFGRTETRAPVFPEVWAPPDDAGTRWYGGNLDHDGTTHVLTFDMTEDEIVAAFEKAAAPIAPSMAERCDLGVVDRVAWKVWRTLPPMSLVVQMLDATAETTASHAATP